MSSLPVRAKLSDGQWLRGFWQEGNDEASSSVYLIDNRRSIPVLHCDHVIKYAWSEIQEGLVGAVFFSTELLQFGCVVAEKYQGMLLVQLGLRSGEKTGWLTLSDLTLICQEDPEPE